MSNLLSLDLTSTLRTAVEQSLPKMRADSLLNSAQAANRSVANSDVGIKTHSSNKDTEAHKDRIEINGNDITSLLTAGMFSTDASTSTADISYTSEAKVINSTQLRPRSTFTIIA